MLKNIFEKAISDATGVNSKDVQVDFSKNLEFGDISSNIALVISKKDNKTPQKIAKSIVEKLLDNNSLMHFVSEIKVEGVGFINFYLKTEYLKSIAKNINLKKEKYGTEVKTERKSVVVEYSSPNIAKPFGIGHFRSTIIGDAVANLLEETGLKVYRDNHLGDWGTQFGKQIYAIKKWGDEKELDKSDNPVLDLVALYIKFHEEAEKDPSLEDEARGWFKKLEEGDSEARRLWQKCIDWSLKEFKRVYGILAVSFTENDGVGYGESYFEDKMEPVIKELSDKGLLKEGEEGAKLVFFEKDKYPPLMILKKDGTTLYATRDLATDKFRLEKYGKDTMIINEVGAEQTLYFRQIFEVEKMLGWVKEGQRVHIKHGLFRFKDRKMSTRKGDTILLEEVIEEAIKRATKLGSESEELAHAVAIGALKWNDLKRDPVGDIVFDWDDILNMEGNSGPYMQYTYARCQSVVKKGKEIKTPNNDCEDTLYEEEKDLLRALVRYEDKIEESATRFSPNTLCEYLFDLAQKYNTFYNKHKIIGSQKEEFRLNLTKATAQVIKNGLNILGIEVPDKM